MSTSSLSPSAVRMFEVQLLPAPSQQRVVGDRLGQRVLELVGEHPGVGALDEQSRHFQPAQRLPELIGRQAADALQQADARDLADRGKRLQHVLVGAREAIDARRQHAAHRRRNRGRPRPHRQPVASRLALQLAGLDHAAHVFLDEQRIAAAAPGQLVLQRRKRIVRAQKVGDHLPRRRPARARRGAVRAARDRQSSRRRIRGDR